VPVQHLVPGDVLLLTPGTYIAADLRLLRSHRLTVDESALTGESLPVGKDHAFAPAEDTVLSDRKNMAYMGTHVTGGNGCGVVVATAEATELGQIQTMVGEAESPETPMQRQLDRMGTQLALLSSAVCGAVFVVGILRGYGWLEMLKSSVSLAVAAVPEGLPAVATTTLAMGIADMHKHNIAVRHLDAVESLGSVQVFCMDKTGTLTMNRMSVVSVYSGGWEYAIREHRFVLDGTSPEPTERQELVRLMQVVSLCSETEIEGALGDFRLEGSATENALVQLALSSGIDVSGLRERHATLRTRYRAEGRPYMSTLHPFTNGKYLLAVKGSPDTVLALCGHQMKNGRRIRLGPQARHEIIAQNERMAGNALRVLGVAYRELDEDRMPDKTEGLTWVGMAGMADPMRPDMDRLIAQYHRAGIHTIMITGDQSATAQAIGRQLGLSGDRPLQVLESSALEEKDPELLAGLARNVRVFARVSPAHKLKIVRAMQEAGYVVAMTGDGINDGPALKAADIGVAMGQGGTNVARDVSDVVLEDDNLHTMAVAVRQGRTIYDNIRKTIHFSESVTGGHPDKLCDQVSDAIVDHFLTQDPYSRIVAECAVSSGVMFISAHYASHARLDIPEIAREVIRNIGYSKDVFDATACTIMTSFMDHRVTDHHSLDLGALDDEDLDRITAKHQVTVFGYACDQTDTLMPLPISLAHRLARLLDAPTLRKRLPYLLPDGKAQVGIEYKGGEPSRIHSVTLVASQCDEPGVDLKQLRDDLQELVVKPVLEAEKLPADEHTRIFINPEGPLIGGGPSAHSGLTGRKTGIDTYGEYARQSGAALSGKDPLRIDRVGAYAARFAAKNIVAAGLARECEVQLSYMIGSATPISLRVRSFGSGRVPDEELGRRIGEVVDFRLGAIVRDLRLQRLPAEHKRGGYRSLAVYGQMGREDLDMPWERTDRADALK
jgi:S-adenosylmethionine synthetase